MIDESKLVLQTQRAFVNFIPLCQAIALICSSYVIYAYLLIELVLHQQWYHFFLVAISDSYIFLLKNIVNRPRPFSYNTQIEKHAALPLDSDASFPSSHALYGYYLGFCLGYPVFGWLLLAWSRVVLGVHHWSDTVASLIIVSSIRYLLGMYCGY
jgi:membrane-associated phospholipid phosphatase